MKRKRLRTCALIKISKLMYFILRRVIFSLQTVQTLAPCSMEYHPCHYYLHLYKHPVSIQWVNTVGHTSQHTGKFV